MRKCSTTIIQCAAGTRKACRCPGPWRNSDYKLAGKIVVKFYGLLRRQVQPPVLEISTAELNILQLLQLAERRTGQNFLDELLDPEKKLLTGTIILVNGENIRLKQNLETRVSGGDTVDLFSPAGGG
ncbi:MAG: MoaD/ThiS family protein [Chrysiogenales bacterium]|nr:MAG: MoaD/ThiS family protein [Chrysiogenales bacterium]